MEEGLAVMDPETMTPVPADGETMGEIMFRGNITMKGYLKNPRATEAAFAGGWFHSGDLAVMHPDGYLKIKDRSKDIIISGGENISSLEVEDVLYRHPAARRRGRRQAGPEVGRDAVRVRRAQARRRRHGIRDHQLLPRPSRPLRCRARCCSASCPRPPPARSRNSCCARRRARRPRSIPEHECESDERRSGNRDPARGAQRHLHPDHEPAGADESAHLQDAFPAVAFEDSRTSKRVVILAAAGKGFCAGRSQGIRELKELPKIERLSASAAA